MSHIEKRKHERIALVRQPRGAVTLRAGDDRYPVTWVKDVSSFGVNIVVGRDVPEKTRVTVEYADESLRLDVYGIVAWRVPDSSGRQGSSDPINYVLGIELFSPTLLTAVLSSA